MPYRAPVAEFGFLLDHVVGFGALAATERFAEANAATAEAILTEAGRLCENVLAPLQRVGDLNPARLENGVVRTSPGFAEAYARIAEGGWVGLSADPDHGGMGLPLTLAACVNEMMSACCMALQLCPLLSQGQIEALEQHADPGIKALYLPRLTSGEWTGTMNLTEAQAGSDVGALRARAEPRGDGTYSISGQKIFITWGDHDVAANICHLVLARLPEAPAGARGVSLFLVPKFIPDAAGEPGPRNAVQTISLEHKLGVHGSPTAVLQFEDAQGWLIGKPHGGMAAMFTMMNNARLNVGVQGVGVAEAAYQQALAYARDRKQGRPAAGETGAIVDHPDVRRMLAVMKAQIFAARSIALANAMAIDMAHATGSADWAARAALLTPICKAYCTDTGIAVAGDGVQIHGGMGFVEETGAAQYLRDVRITSIYEGTNGIQAADLVGRKMSDAGEAAMRLLQEVQDTAEAARSALPDLAEDLWAAAEAMREGTETLVAQPMVDRLAGSVPYLRAFALVLGAQFHLKAALAEGRAGPRRALAQVFLRRILPEVPALLAQMREGAEALYALSPDDLAA